MKSKIECLKCLEILGHQDLFFGIEEKKFLLQAQSGDLGGRAEIFPSRTGSRGAPNPTQSKMSPLPFIQELQ